MLPFLYPLKTLENLRFVENKKAEPVKALDTSYTKSLMVCVNHFFRELMNIESEGKGAGSSSNNNRFNIGQYVSEKEQRPGCCG